MRKILLSISLLIAGCFNAFCQSVPNGDFENWTLTNYQDVQFYLNQAVNRRALQTIGQLVTTKVTDPFHGSFAVKMETKTNGIDTVAGYFINGNPGGNQGGMPILQAPTGITGHYKCNIMPGDTGFIFMVFKKNGSPISGGMFLKKFNGTQATYASFNYTFSLGIVPDSVILGATCSNLLSNNFKGIPGSFLQLDSLNFKGMTAQPVLMNGSFENWVTNTIYTPNGWTIKGDSVNRSTSSYTNTYALTLQMVDYGNYKEPDQVTTGYWTNCCTKGGYPYTLQNDSLIGYYKMNAVNNDTGMINLNGTKLASPVGGYGMYFTNQPTYKRFSMPINFSSAADTLRIDISAAKWPTNPAWVGSKLWVDALHLQSQPLKVPVLFMGENYISTYPNPSKGVFNLVYDSESDAPVKLEIYNEVGQLILKDNIKSNGFKNLVDLTNYNKGLYLLKTEQNGVISTQRVLVD